MALSGGSDADEVGEARDLILNGVKSHKPAKLGEEIVE